MCDVESRPNTDIQDIMFHLHWLRDFQSIQSQCGPNSPILNLFTLTYSRPNCSATI